MCSALDDYPDIFINKNNFYYFELYLFRYYCNVRIDNKIWTTKWRISFQQWIV